MRWNRRSLLEIITYCFNSVTIIITCLFYSYGKVRARSLFFKRSQGSAIKLYFFSFCILLSNNFNVSFLVSLTVLVWYNTPRQLHVVFSFKLNLFRPDSEKYHNLKEDCAFELSKESSVSLTKQNLTKSYIHQRNPTKK